MHSLFHPTANPCRSFHVTCDTWPSTQHPAPSRSRRHSRNFDFRLWRPFINQHCGCCIPQQAKELCRRTLSSTLACGVCFKVTPISCYLQRAGARWNTSLQSSSKKIHIERQRNRQSATTDSYSCQTSTACGPTLKPIMGDLRSVCAPRMAWL